MNAGVHATAKIGETCGGSILCLPGGMCERQNKTCVAKGADIKACAASGGCNDDQFCKISVAADNIPTGVCVQKGERGASCDADYVGSITGSREMCTSTLNCLKTKSGGFMCETPKAIGESCAELDCMGGLLCDDLNVAAANAVCINKNSLPAGKKCPPVSVADPPTYAYDRNPQFWCSNKRTSADPGALCIDEVCVARLKVMPSPLKCPLGFKQCRDDEQGGLNVDVSRGVVCAKPSGLEMQGVTYDSEDDVCRLKFKAGDACKFDEECGGKYEFQDDGKKGDPDDSKQLYCIHEKCALQSGEGGKCGSTKQWPAGTAQDTDNNMHCQGFSGAPAPGGKMLACLNLVCIAFTTPKPTVFVPTTTTTTPFVCKDVALGEACTKQCECENLATKHYGEKEPGDETTGITDAFCKGMPATEVLFTTGYLAGQIKRNYHDYQVGTFSSAELESPTFSGTCSMPIAIGERGCRRMGRYNDLNAYKFPKGGLYCPKGEKCVPNPNMRCVQPAVCLDEKSPLTKDGGKCVALKEVGEDCEAPPGYSDAKEYVADLGYHEQCKGGYCDEAGKCVAKKAFGETCHITNPASAFQSKIEMSAHCGLDSLAWTLDKSTGKPTLPKDLGLCTTKQRKGEEAKSLCLPWCSVDDETCPDGYLCDTKAKSGWKVEVLYGSLVSQQRVCYPKVEKPKIGDACDVAGPESVMHYGNCDQEIPAVCIRGEYNWTGNARSILDGEVCMRGYMQNAHGDCLNGRSCVQGHGIHPPFPKDPDTGYTRQDTKQVYEPLRCCGGDDDSNKITARRLPDGTIEKYLTLEDFTTSRCRGECAERAYKAYAMSFPRALLRGGKWAKKGTDRVSCEEYMEKTGYDTCCRRPTCIVGRCDNTTMSNRKPISPDFPWIEYLSTSRKHEENMQESMQTQCVKQKKPGEVCEGYSYFKTAWWHDQCPDGYCDKDTLICTKKPDCMKDWECGRAKNCYGADDATGATGKCLPKCGKYFLGNPTGPTKEWKVDLKCGEDDFCSDGSCFPRKAIGEACPGGASCVKGAICEGETCVKLPEPAKPDDSTAVDGAISINVMLPIFSACAYTVMFSI